MYSQSLLDSIDKFYDKNNLSYSFSESRHLSNDKSIINYTGNVFSYKEDNSIYYRIDFASKQPFLKYETVKNNLYYGRNDYYKNSFCDYKIKKEKVHYFYDGQTPGHVFMQADSFLKKTWLNPNFLEITQTQDHFVITYSDTLRSTAGQEGLDYKLATKYVISRQDYRILSSEYDMVYLANSAELHNRSEFTYSYYEISEDILRKKINEFIPLQEKKKEIKPLNLDLPDSIKTFPSFRLEDTASKFITEKDIKGRFVLVDFWYKSCAPCLANMQNLGKIRKSFDKSELEIIAINPRESLDLDLKRMVFKFDNGCAFLFDAKHLINALNLRAYPTTIIYDNSTKKIIYHHIGASIESTEKLIVLLKDYLKTQ